jgi:hypothetical protein
MKEIGMGDRVVCCAPRRVGEVTQIFPAKRYLDRDEVKVSWNDGPVGIYVRDRFVPGEFETWKMV